MRLGLPAFASALVGALFLSIFTAHALEDSGAIWVVKVEGNAWLEAASKTRLVKNARIDPGSTVATEPNGNVVLLFQNGSTVNVRSGSRFSVKDFACDSFDTSKADWRTLKSEPGKSSRTAVRVEDGCIIANIRSLNKGSKFDIGTPLGTAGIRGTIVVAEVDMQNAENPVTFGVADGSAVFTANSGDTRNVDGGSAVGVSAQGRFTPAPANAGQLLSTARQVGRTMMLSVPPMPSSADVVNSVAGAANTQADAQAQSGPQLTGAPSPGGGGPVVITTSSGTVTVIRNGAQTDGSSILSTRLEPGTIITTGEDGTAEIEISPGNVIRVQPNTQLTIGQTRTDRAVNDAGDAIPQTEVTLAVGTVVANTPPGLGAVPQDVLDLIRLPFGKTWQNASPEDIREAVLAAVKRNPDRAPELVQAAIQSVRMTGRFPSSGAGDAKQVVEDDGNGETSLEELAAMIGSAATEGNPAMADAIAQAVNAALRSGGLSTATFVIITPRGTVSPVIGGVTVVSSTGADPTTSTVTVASPSGMDIVITTDGEQLPVDTGQVVILRPDGIEYAGIQDYPNLPGANVTPPVPLPPVAPPPPNPPAPTPSPTPTPSPSPVSP